MATFNTIHIFSYGETQLISGDVNYKQRTADTSAAATVISDIESLRPESTATGAYHVIHIFNNGTVSYLSEDDESSFKVSVDALNQESLNSLVEELMAAYSASV